MVKRKGHRSRGGNSMMGILKPLAIGAIAAYASRYVPIQVPMKPQIAGGLGAYALGGKSMTSIALGAVGAYGLEMLMPANNGGQSSIILY